MELILRQFKGLEIVFDENGWVNATQAAKVYGKDFKQYQRGKRFKEYLESVKKLRGVKNTPLKKTVVGKGKEQGIYLHPYLAVEFARYLDSDFAVQMDMWFEDEMKLRIKHFEKVNELSQSMINELTTERDAGKWWMNGNDWDL